MKYLRLTLCVWAGYLLFAINTSWCLENDILEGDIVKVDPFVARQVARLMADIHRKYSDKIENLQADLHDFNTRFTEQEQRYKKLEQKYDALAQKMEHDGQNKRYLLPNESAGDQIAFFTQLTHPLKVIGTHQAIVFDRVVTNLGNGYNHVDGEFTAPISGVYVFIWKIGNWDRTHMITYLVVNAVEKARILSDSHDLLEFNSATGVVILSINAGDTVWIRTDANHVGQLAGDTYCTFSGWLLY